MIIGGAEDKLGKRTILKEFVSASGGAHARIAVIATASSLGPEVVEVYDALFRKLGAAEVVSVRPESREEAHDPDLVAEIGKATGVFMTGGNQLKLSSVICGTPFADAIVEAHRTGAVIAGTSAGASIQSSHMVAFGGPGSTPKQRMTQVAAGLGLLEVVGDRPALRPAQPLRPAADDRQPVAVPARASASTRTPRRSSRRSTGTRCCGSSAAARSTIFDPARHRHQRPRGQALDAPPGQRRDPARAPRRRAVRPDHADPDPPGGPWSTRTRRPRSPRPARTCARWPATSPPDDVVAVGAAAADLARKRTK